MNLAEFDKLQKNGEKLICEQCLNEQLYSLATKVWSKQCDETLESATSSMQTFRKGVDASAVELLSDDEIYPLCDMHAPETAVKLVPPASIVNPAAGLNLAKIRSSTASQFGIHLESTGARAAAAVSDHIIMHTLDASPTNPYLVEFDQFIIDPFTGPGQFDLAERDSIRQVSDGASAGKTAVITSATMNFQTGDVGKIIQVGRHPGKVYSILSRQSALQVTLSRSITPGTGLTLTMEGETQATLATKTGFSDGVTTGAWSRLAKVITTDKIYSVTFVPGSAGAGIYSIQARALKTLISNNI